MEFKSVPIDGYTLAEAALSVTNAMPDKPWIVKPLGPAITPVDALLDGLVAQLSEKTGHQWQRRDAWDVTVTIMLGGRPWGYLHTTSLMKLDNDPAGYADMVAAHFERAKAQQNLNS